jgi:hypothetical protein
MLASFPLASTWRMLQRCAARSAPGASGARWQAENFSG